MTSVEINDPVDCRFIFGAAATDPPEERARVCPKCEQPTWAHSSTCTHCGYDRWSVALRWMAVLASTLLLALTARNYLG